VLASLAVIYVLVLVSSFIGICALLGVRVLMRNRSVRKFVRSIRQRVHLAEERGAVLLPETPIERPRKSPRTSAIALQESRTLVRKAEKALAQNKNEEAERAFIQALTVTPDAYDVQAQLAKFYLQTNREQKAEALYKELVASHDNASYHANLGLAYYRQEKYLDACKSYQYALNKDPTNPERAAALGRACMAARRYSEAAQILEKACKRLARDTELLGLLAECYLQLQSYDLAQNAYMRINKLEPYNESVKEKLKQLAHA
jgi:tetratricopeptide (TPR) repeat protein